jgi:hypothetical protein
LSAVEPERLHERRIETRETVINDADDEKKIQEGGDNDPPAVEQALGWIFCHGKVTPPKNLNFDFVIESGCEAYPDGWTISSKFGT